MTETLIYNTPNSEEILRKIHNFSFKKAWNGNLAKNNKNLFWGTVFLSLGGFLLYYEKQFGYFFIGFAIMYLSLFFTFHSQYRKHKNTFNKQLAKEIKDLNENSKDVFWEFTPTHFRFQNYKHEFKFTWDGITYCLLEDQYLYITTMPNLSFILDKANIDTDHFQNIIEYLRHKSIIKAI